MDKDFKEITKSFFNSETSFESFIKCRISAKKRNLKILFKDKDIVELKELNMEAKTFIFNSYFINGNIIIDIKNKKLYYNNFALDNIKKIHKLNFSRVSTLNYDYKILYNEIVTKTELIDINSLMLTPLKVKLKNYIVYINELLFVVKDLTQDKIDKKIIKEG